MKQKHLYIIVGTLLAVILAFVVIAWYFSKQQANLSKQDIKMEVVSENMTSNNPKNEDYVKFKVKRKTHFHSTPNINDIRKAYILEGDKGGFTSFDGNFGYALYTNSNGVTTEGWILLKDTDIIK